MKKLTIVKVGGNIINHSEKLNAFLKDFAKVKTDKILVHGGGNKASEIMQKLGIAPKMINGKRITDTKTLEIITGVYAGFLNKNIVAKLQKNHCNALGLSGADAGMIQAKKRKIKKIDYGFVGDIESIDNEMITLFLEQKITPVFCAITCDKKGQLLNTNADAVAAHLAIFLAKKYEISLVYVFEKQGVLENVADEKSILEKIDKNKYEYLKKEKIITEGMLPKLKNCFRCLEKGVQKIHIGNEHLLANFEQKHTILTL